MGPHFLCVQSYTRLWHSAAQLVYMKQHIQYNTPYSSSAVHAATSLDTAQHSTAHGPATWQLLGLTEHSTWTGHLQQLPGSIQCSRWTAARILAPVRQAGAGQLYTAQQQFQYPTVDNVVAYPVVYPRLHPTVNPGTVTCGRGRQLRPWQLGSGSASASPCRQCCPQQRPQPHR